jgi:nitrite reductase (NADH) small subunit
MTPVVTSPPDAVPVCELAEIPMGEGRAVTVDGRRIAIFRTEAGVFAIDQACPHAGGPLADGIASDCTVICPLHERRYSLEDGAPIGHDGSPVPTHPVETRGGTVYLTVAG